MTRRTTTVRIPEELADTAEVVARARGMSVNALILDALQSEGSRRNASRWSSSLTPGAPIARP